MTFELYEFLNWIEYLKVPSILYLICGIKNSVMLCLFFFADRVLVQ